MNTQTVYNSTASAARDFFGPKPPEYNTGAQAFMQEWKQLSADDKDEIRAGLQALGYQFTPTKL